MNCFIKANVSILILSIFGMAHADIKITSPNGNVVVFSEAKTGEHVDADSWSKLLFISGGKVIDLSRNDRYYTEDGSSKTSPSGNYLVVNNISDGYVDTGDEKKYSDRAYCSIVDMRSGCVVSDWDGEACGYDWVKGKDVLAESEIEGAETFDFMSAKPSIAKIKKPLSLLTSSEVSNTLRCDRPNDKNIAIYQQLIKQNTNSKNVVLGEIVNYLNSLKTIIAMGSKTPLYTSPSDDAKTKEYLISGDKVKFIQFSTDKKWVNVGYINPKGMPLITWIKQ